MVFFCYRLCTNARIEYYTRANDVDNANKVSDCAMRAVEYHQIHNNYKLRQNHHYMLQLHSQCAKFSPISFEHNDWFCKLIKI